MPKERLHDLICFAHLRWDWVYQRPQHLLSRLARDHGYRIFYVEEPQPPTNGAQNAHWSCSEVAPNIVRCVPHFNAEWPFFLDDDGDDTRQMRQLVRLLVEEHEIGRPVVWCYTPLAFPLLRDLQPGAVVYDCMDELSFFKDAPAALLEREMALLQRADIVFTGGRSMYQARVGKHPNLHLFASSVDTAHFARAQAPETVTPDDARRGEPTLGFYGVLDERLDLALIDEVAARRPDWQFVLVGPVIKIAPEELPQRPNLHYTGQQPYKALPGYLKGWDVCLMPFARNDATKFISPTKTLEYLAAGKPIVSTSVPDVVAGYTGIVRFADTPATFVASIDALLTEGPDERQRRLAAGRAVLARTSWSRTAARMADLIADAVAVRTPAVVASTVDTNTLGLS